MIKRGLKNWKDISDLQGMLFFGQRMDELLFHYSMDTYKTPTLNIKLLLREYLETVDSIKEGLLKDKNCLLYTSIEQGHMNRASLLLLRGN